MNARLARNVIAVLVVILLWAGMFLSAGCSGQGVKLDVETSNTPCGDKRVKFSTDYQVEELEIGREIAGADAGGGCGGGYTVSLGKGTTKDSEMSVILELLRMIQSMIPGAAGAGDDD